MTGRGIDQILPHPVAPVLYEPCVRDVRDYVRLAERAHGAIERPVGFGSIWGDALTELRQRRPDLRIINLETSITTSPDYWPGKGIHYRMHPANLPCLSAAAIDACALANNHVLDWGYRGLRQTLAALRKAHIACSGAGNNQRQAAQPARLTLDRPGRVLLFSYGSGCSGIPAAWQATAQRAGVNRLADLGRDSAQRVAAHIRACQQPGDLLIVSIHWGGNWGYAVSEAQREFAHQLIDTAGVAIVHGHSSHHVKGIEVYRDRLILYGCGDFLNDYEGIGGDEAYRGDLTLMYFVSLEPVSGRLRALEMVPLQIQRLRLQRAARQDVLWLAELLNRQGQRFGNRVEVARGNGLQLRWR